MQKVGIRSYRYISAELKRASTFSYIFSIHINEGEIGGYRERGNKLEGTGLMQKKRKGLKWGGQEKLKASTQVISARHTIFPLYISNEDWTSKKKKTSQWMTWHQCPSISDQRTWYSYLPLEMLLVISGYSMNITATILYNLLYLLPLLLLLVQSFTKYSSKF